ncbi:unnamed protein product [Caenorhabditis angaria]|uniref:TOG domain-containing protein n=1 Tax=Caenorhabditis angaria TaxID=860376 RepID=A0A9P1MYU9_9PELO|nr:unnamed protein product [Caenorhabditis angaria]
MDSNWLHILLQSNSADPLERLKLGEILLNEVSQRKISAHSKLVNDFLDVMTQWLSGSNFKVTQIGLEILDSALKFSPEVLASYYFDRLNILIEKMGDSKQTVRDMAIHLLLSLAYLENSSPTILLDRLTIPGTGFEHKQWLVKVGAIYILKEFLNTSFALVIHQTLQIIPQLCRLTNDPNVEVRDISSSVIVDLMVYGGVPIVQKIQSTKIINDQKMTILMQKYQSTVATRGDLPPKHSIQMDVQPQQRNAFIRRSLRSPAKIIYPSRLSTPPKNNLPINPTTTSAISPSRSRDMTRSTINRPNTSMSVSRYRSSSSAPVSSVCQDDFRKAFNAVPKTTIYSNHDVLEKVELARNVLMNTNEDWSKRANQLKLIRSIILNSDDNIDRRILINSINQLADALEISIRDLRSQIVREASVTCSFIFETFGNEARNIAETVLPAALSQLAVSTKIMATSAATLTTFIVQKIHSRQIFSILSELSNSKSKEQRRQLLILSEIIISTWDIRSKQPILKQLANIIKNAINDADSETRTNGRKAFQKFETYHAELADQIFRELDNSKQKMLREGVASSSSSINSDRENNSRPNNISQKFLSQRSSSAIDAKQITIPTQSVTQRPTVLSKLPKSSTFSTVKSSGYGQLKCRPQQNRPNSPSQSIPKSSSSSPSSSTIQTPIMRIASNLGSSSFVASLTVEQANNLQFAMDKAKDEMNRDIEEDDDFLLAPPKSTPPPRTILQSSPESKINPIEHILKACTSSSFNEKKDGIKQLSSVILDQKLTDFEIRQIGDVLTRLLAEGNTTILIQILETLSSFIKIYHKNLEGWMKLALGKLFAKMGAEALPNIKYALNQTQKAFLISFEPWLQLKSVCQFMCDPINLLVPKSRLALLEYLCLLFEDIWPEDDCNNSIDAGFTRLAIRKMFAWMFDQRSGPILMPACERLICAMFALNAADFTMIFNDLSPECRDWAYRILQLNGQKSVEKEKEQLCNNNDKSYNEETIPIRYDSPVRTDSPIRQQYSNNNCNNYQIETPRRSTAHLANNIAEQSNYIRTQLENMRNLSTINESMTNLHAMMCEGAFTLWNQYFDELLDSIYQILSTNDNTIRKKTALRILMKMCNAQASKLFDSTEIAISKVLQAAVSSDDSTMSIAAEDCLRTLATHLPLIKIISISRKILGQDDDLRSTLILKMLTRMFQEIDVDELSLIVDDVAPCFVEAYESRSSSVRKCAVFGLVALVQRIGMPRMEPHLKTLNSSKLNLIDLYVGRAKSSESGSSGY